MLARDWLVRIWCLWSIYKSSEETVEAKQDAIIGLFIMLGGKKAVSVDWRSSSSCDSVTELRSHVEHLMSQTAETILNNWYGDISTSFNKPSSWRVIKLRKMDSLSTPQSNFLSTARQRLSKLCNLNEDQLQIGLLAHFQRCYGSGALGSHERLNVGDAVQILLHINASNAIFLHTKLCSSGLPTFFVIGGLFTDSVRISWSVVNKCALCDGEAKQLPTKQSFIRVQTTSFYMSTTASTLQFLRLTPNVRKVGFLHDCFVDGGCIFNTTSRSLKHSTTTLEGGTFLLMTRYMGYPPRRSWYHTAHTFSHPSNTSNR